MLLFICGLDFIVQIINGYNSALFQWAGSDEMKNQISWGRRIANRCKHNQPALQTLNHQPLVANEGECAKIYLSQSVYVVNPSTLLRDHLLPNQHYTAQHFHCQLSIITCHLFIPTLFKIKANSKATSFILLYLPVAPPCPDSIFMCNSTILSSVLKVRSFAVHLDGS